MRMAKLSEYLEAHRLSQRKFAEMVEVDPSIVSRLVKRAMVPSLALATRIQTVTRGAVTATSWVVPSQITSSNTADRGTPAPAGQRERLSNPEGA